MNETYRQQELERARKEMAKAEAALAACKAWGARKRDAAEQVEFWGNKVAFLACAK